MVRCSIPRLCSASIERGSRRQEGVAWAMRAGRATGTGIKKLLPLSSRCQREVNS